MTDQGKISSWSTKAKLLLLLLIVFVPTAAVILLLSLDRRNHEMKDAGNSALILVESLAAQHEQLVFGTKEMLSTLALLPEVQRLDVKACNEIFRQLQGQNPFYSAITAANPDGEIVASFPEVPPGGINIADRKHVREVISTLDFSAGEYVVGRHVKLPSIHFGYPVLGDENGLTAILGAGFNLAEYARFLQRANLPEGSSVTIADHRGVRLYRNPEDKATPVGEPIVKPLLEAMTEKETRGIFETRGADGVFRIYAFKHVRLKEEMPPYLFMIVGLPKEPILQRANLEMLRSLGLLGVIAAFAAALAWFFGNHAIVRPLRQLLNAAKQLGMGRMDTRTGLPHTTGELGRLAKTFDRMAALLEAKDKAQRSAEDMARKTAQRLELAVASGRICVWDWDILKGELFWDDGMIRLYGVDEQSLPIRFETWEKAFHPDDLARSKDELQAALRGEREYEPEFRIVMPDGTIKTIKGNGIVIRDEAGKPIRMIGLNRDITEQKQAEELVWIQRELALALGSVSGLNDALDVLLRTALRIDGIDSGGIYVVDPGAGGLHLIAHRGLSPWFVEKASFYSPGSPEDQFAMRSEPAYWSTSNCAFESTEALAKEGVRALASIPVKWEGQVVALLNLASHSEDMIPTIFRDALEAIAGRIGAIMARVRAEEALRRSEEISRRRAEELEKLMDLAPVGILVSRDAQCRSVVANKAARRMYEMDGGLDVSSGAPREEIFNSQRRFFHEGEELGPEELPMRQAALRGEDVMDYELSVLLPSGRKVTLLGNASPLLDDRGVVRGCVGIYLDISERKVLERTQSFLAQASSIGAGEDFFQSLAHHLGESLGMDFVCIDELEGDGLSAKTLAVYHDGRFEDNITYALKDTPCGKVVEKNQTCCFPKGVRHIFAADAVLQELKAESYVGTVLWDSRGEQIGLIALIGRRPLEDQRLLESILKLVGVRASGELERKRGEEALRRSESELRYLSSKLLTSQEEERKRIAVDLHDGLGGSLSAVKISLENTRGQMELGASNPELLEIPIAWTQHLIDEARRLMSELRPSILDDFGAIAAVKWLLNQFRATYTRIHVEEEIQIEEEEIPEMLKTVIFRIAQEAFHNIAKYSQAEFASFSLVGIEGAIELAIEDSGEGFDLEAALSNISERKGLGLTSMKERCELSGGVFHMGSIAGEGTVIRASWPIAIRHDALRLVRLS